MAAIGGAWIDEAHGSGAASIGAHGLAFGGGVEPVPIDSAGAPGINGSAVGGSVAGFWKGLLSASNIDSPRCRVAA